MTKKNMMLGALGLVIAGATVFGTGASAYQGDAGKTGPNYSPERHEQMEEAFESNNYDAWKSLMSGKGRVLEVVNKENFNRFAEAHNLAKEDKTDEANKILTELGLGQGKGKSSGQRGQNRMGNFVDANKDGICDRLQ
jgi:hypothetical protein